MCGFLEKRLCARQTEMRQYLMVRILPVGVGPKMERALCHDKSTNQHDDREAIERETTTVNLKVWILPVVIGPKMCVSRINFWFLNKNKKQKYFNIFIEKIPKMANKMPKRAKKKNNKPCDPFQAQSEIIFHPIFFCDFWKETKNKQNLCVEREAMKWVKMVKTGLFLPKIIFFSIFVRKGKQAVSRGLSTSNRFSHKEIVKIQT